MMYFNPLSIQELCRLTFNMDDRESHNYAESNELALKEFGMEHTA